MRDTTPTAPEGDFMPPALRAPRKQPAPIPLPDRAAVEAAAAIRDAKSRRTLQRHERQRKACEAAREEGVDHGYRRGKAAGIEAGERSGHLRGWRAGAVQGAILMAVVLLVLQLVVGNLGSTVITGPLS